MKALTRTNLVALLSALIVAAAPAALAKQESNDKSDSKPRISTEISTTAKNEMTPLERRNVSIAAGRILKHVHQARVAVAAKDAKTALEQVAKGLTLVDIIEKVRPTYEVAAKITAGDLVYEDKDEVQALVIPLYEELDDVIVIHPVAQEQKSAAAAADKTGSKPSGKKAGTETGKTTAKKGDEKTEPAFVGDAELEYTSVKLNIALAKAGLKAARKTLEGDKDVKFDLADTALAAVQRSVIFEFVEVDEPLQRARTNLGIAKSLLDGGKWKTAQAALKVASDSLQSYGDGVAEHRSKEVTALKKEIDELIAKEKQLEKAAEKVQGWWDRISKWFH